MRITQGLFECGVKHIIPKIQISIYSLVMRMQPYTVTKGTNPIYDTFKTILASGNQMGVKLKDSIKVKVLDNTYDNKIDLLITSVKDPDVRVIVSFTGHDIAPDFTKYMSFKNDLGSLAGLVFGQLYDIFVKWDSDLIKSIKKLKKEKAYLRIKAEYSDDRRSVVTYTLKYQTVYIPDIRKISRSVKIKNKSVRIAEINKHVIVEHTLKVYAHYIGKAPIVNTDYIHTMYPQKALVISMPVTQFKDVYHNHLKIVQRLIVLWPFRALFNGVNRDILMEMISAEMVSMSPFLTLLVMDRNKRAEFFKKYYAIQLGIKEEGYEKAIRFILKEYSDDHVAYGTDVVHKTRKLTSDYERNIKMISSEYYQLIETTKSKLL